MSNDTPRHDDTLVSIWQTTEATVLPHVLATLAEAGIEYMVQDRGLATELMGQRSTVTVGETEPPLTVLVREADAGRAREIIAALLSAPTSGTGGGPTPASVPDTAVSAVPPGGGGDVDLFDEETGAPLGTLAEGQLAELMTYLELESIDDRDVYIDAATIEMLESKSVNAATLALLKRALGAKSGVDVRWAPRS